MTGDGVHFASGYHHPKIDEFKSTNSFFQSDLPER
jgi:hypothetical protein